MLQNKSLDVQQIDQIKPVSNVRFATIVSMSSIDQAVGSFLKGWNASLAEKLAATKQSTFPQKQQALCNHSLKIRRLATYLFGSTSSKPRFRGYLDRGSYFSKSCSCGIDHVGS